MVPASQTEKDTIMNMETIVSIIAMQNEEVISRGFTVTEFDEQVDASLAALNMDPNHDYAQKLSYTDKFFEVVVEELEVKRLANTIDALDCNSISVKGLYSIKHSNDMDGDCFELFYLDESVGLLAVSDIYKAIDLSKSIFEDRRDQLSADIAKSWEFVESTLQA